MNFIHVTWTGLNLPDIRATDHTMIPDAFQRHLIFALFAADVNQKWMWWTSGAGFYRLYNLPGSLQCWCIEFSIRSKPSASKRILRGSVLLPLAIQELPFSLLFDRPLSMAAGQMIALAMYWIALVAIVFGTLAGYQRGRQLVAVPLMVSAMDSAVVWILHLDMMLVARADRRNHFGRNFERPAGLRTMGT